MNSNPTDLQQHMQNEDQKRLMRFKADVDLAMNLVALTIGPLLQKAGPNEDAFDTLDKCFKLAKEGVKHQHTLLKNYGEHHFGKEFNA